MIAIKRQAECRLNGFMANLTVAISSAKPKYPPTIKRTRWNATLAIAREAQARIEILDGQDPIETLLKFAHEHGVTQIFVGHSTREQWWERFTGTPLDRIILRRPTTSMCEYFRH